MARNLHIGGTVRHPDWEVLNAMAGPCVDHVCNANDLSRFADNTFDKVYASHVAEHLDFKEELQQTLKGWQRVLVPDGMLFVSVPDLDVLAGMLVDKQHFSVEDRFSVMMMLFGGHVDQHDYHVVGLNQEFLAVFLSRAGFVNIQRVRNFGIFADTSGMEFKGVPISLNLIAQKPGA